MTRRSIYDTITYVRKAVLIDKRAEKELRKFSRTVQLKFQALFEILEEDGKLEEPFGKKLSGRIDLFEIRVRQNGQWRALYAYIGKDSIIILCAFAKKTQKTPIIELDKAIKRLVDYKE
ncbi:type II toxin-antitoxin system RelE/ParE family toxin [Patescibacteria group bacterium]|nr:type II toxin-antitoxin system RelE/ParE family toxin [Patescibacteria group bacterium]MBU4016999.1 type II toxin-antitoxin system RelE/ParE family toxin [Patescibacteria group bacterium]MBU4098980.1 type II toxin-antitoxin system RelE/ParE family toxin [Patescibacteria group bacterium]